MDPLLLEDVSDREEGEIVEDDLEDVSDCSLTAGSPQNPGKSVSPPEILNGVCLSRASKRLIRDKPYIYYGNQRRRARRKKRNSHNEVSKKHHTKFRRPSIIEIISDSDDEAIDPRYAKQLREALCRESAEASTNNSLKTRLKALIDNNSHSEDDSNVDALRDLALLSTLKPLQPVEVSTKDNEISNFNNGEIVDSIDPELQELRLEALKSVILKNHERRKRKANEISDDKSCETDMIQVAKDTDKENDQSIINNKKIKIDGENLSASNDLPPPSNVDSVENPEEDADILRAVLLASMSKSLSTKSNNTDLRVPQLPKVVVKPLIINLNADSDSDTENLDSSPPKHLKNTVSEFLKRQRAEVEANVKKKPNNTHPSSLSKRNDLMNKSVMKLLPRSQQLEYHKLKQQLLNAHKRVRTRRNSNKFLANNKKEVTHTTNSTKKLTIYKTATSLTNNNRIFVNNGAIKNNVEKKSDSTINHLERTLDDLQITKNGRLQMKGKYRSLGPLLNKINKASCERQQHEILIKKLLQEIQIVRTKLASSHQTFTDLVHQLVQEKSAIDKGVRQLSAPVVVNSVPVKENPKTEEKRATPTVDNLTTASSKESEQPLLDPNDITKIFVKEYMEDISIPKYISPLNYRTSTTDPETTICPYDLLGVCKDKECPYVHYSCVC